MFRGDELLCGSPPCHLNPESQHRRDLDDGPKGHRCHNDLYVRIDRCADEDHRRARQHADKDRGLARHRAADVPIHIVRCLEQLGEWPRTRPGRRRREADGRIRPGQRQHLFGSTQGDLHLHGRDMLDMGRHTPEGRVHGHTARRPQIVVHLHNQRVRRSTSTTSRTRPHRGTPTRRQTRTRAAWSPSRSTRQAR